MRKFFFIAFFGLFLLACQSTSELTSAPKKVLNEKDNIAFGRAFLDGSKEKILGNYEAAEKYLKQAIAIDNTSAAAYYELGLVYNYQKNYQASFESFEKANQLDPNNYWYKLSYASFLENTGDIDRAIDVFKELVEQNPSQIELKYQLSKLLVGQARYSEGISILDDIEDKVGVNEEISFLKQRIYLYQNNVDGAAGEIKRLIKAFPEEIRYYAILSDVYLSNERKEEAYEVFQEMKKLDPNNYLVHFSLAEYYRSENLREEYLKEIQLAFENPAMNIDDKVKYVLSYYQVDSRDEAAKKEGISLCESIVIGHPQNAKSYALLADFLYFDNQNERAKEAYQKTVGLDSSRFPVWNQLLVILSETGDTEGLIEYGGLAVNLFPSQATSYLLLGLGLAQEKKYEEAIEYMQLGKDLVVNNTGLKSQFYSSLGDSYYELKDYVSSDDSYDKALELDPNNVYVLNNYSYYLSLRKDKLDQAKEMSLRSNNLSPGQASFQDTYAWILFQLEEYQEALVWINKAIGNESTASAVLLEHKGDILYKMGQKEEALRYWELASNKAGASDQLEKKIQNKTWYE